MMIEDVLFITPLKNLSYPLYNLAKGQLSYQKAIEEGELWTQAALKLSFTVAMFFSYRVAISMRNPLLGLTLVVVNSCIHPRANVDALFLISLTQYLSSFGRAILYRCPSHLINPWPISTAVSVIPYKFGKDYDKRNLAKGNNVEVMNPLEKTRYYSLWLDQKIFAVSKVAAPHIASFFKYQPADD